MNEENNTEINFPFTTTASNSGIILGTNTNKIVINVNGVSYSIDPSYSINPNDLGISTTTINSTSFEIKEIKECPRFTFINDDTKEIIEVFSDGEIKYSSKLESETI